MERQVHVALAAQLASVLLMLSPRPPSVVVASSAPKQERLWRLYQCWGLGEWGVGVSDEPGKYVMPSFPEVG